jgi:hypothetical protein
VDATIIAGTGAYAGAAGTLSGVGTLDAQQTPGVYDTTQALTGTIEVPDPTPAPSVSGTATPSPTSTASVGLLPDTASPRTETPLPAVVALAAVLAAAVAYGGFTARRRE